jgi:hypothetical protein
LVIFPAIIGLGVWIVATTPGAPKRGESDKSKDQQRRREH